MFTSQKKVFSPLSLTPRRENQNTPVPNSNSNARVSGNGGTVSENADDLEDLDERVAKLENEVGNYRQFATLLA